MPHQVIAFKAGQGLITLHREGTDLDAIKARLADEGYRVIDVSSTCTTPFGTGRQTFSPTLFAQQLHDLLSVGLKLIEALEFLARRERKSNRPGLAVSICAR